jgi:hypothetical protein
MRKTAQTVPAPEFSGVVAFSALGVPMCLVRRGQMKGEKSRVSKAL